MSVDEKIKNLEEELARARLDLSSYRLAAGRVGDHLAEIAELNRELDRSRNEINLILDTTSDAMRLVDRSFNIIWSNKSMEDFCGLPASRLKGNKCREVIGTKRCHGEDCLLRKAMQENRRLVVEEEVMVAGEERECIITASPFHDGDGNVIGILEDFIDITNRKKIEMELRESEEKYRTLFENSADGFFLMTDIFLDCNHQACRLWACEREDIIGHSPAEFSPEFQPDGRPSTKAAAEVINAAFRGYPQRFYWKHLRKDGILIDTEVSLNRFRVGEDYLLLAAVRDITARKNAEVARREMEEELLKARKLKSIGLLAGGIAHDFNNILATILGNISLLKLEDRSGTEAHKSLTQAEAACLRARGLTRQLLTFSSGGSPIKKTIPIGELIRESAGFALHGSNVKCRFRLPEDLWPVEVDPGQMGQVINNLVINADQAMPAGGEMEIRAANQEISVDENGFLPPDRYVRVEVEDTGIGIPESIRKKIFDPYFTTKQKGSGLGLATVYSIIDKHDGRISVSSGEGTGTLFTFFIPASDRAPADITEESDRVINQV